MRRKPDHVSDEWWDKTMERERMSKMRGDEYIRYRTMVERRDAGKPKCDCGQDAGLSSTWCAVCDKTVAVRWVKLSYPKKTPRGTIYQRPICRECGSAKFVQCPKCGNTGYLPE